MKPNFKENLSERIAKNNPSAILPTGTLTFLFTDIEGSTHLWEQYPEQMRITMRRHDELIETEVMQNSGKIVRPRGEGDSRFAVFPRAIDALRASISIQRLIFNEPWIVPALQVRMALHSGDADLRDGDYYGSTVNRCAKLRSLAHGGQILISEITRWLVQDELPSDVSLHDLGEYNLKGIQKPVHVFQPIVNDLPTEFPPLISPEKIHNNLPFSLTSFIGREKDVQELENLLSRSRLLTITGPGGAGKTRLAIKVANNIQGSFPDGVWFIDLASISSTSLLSRQVMNVLGIREEVGFTPDQTLIYALQNKTLLLIFDNCEHLIKEVSQLVEDILHNGARLRILATSREKLGLSGEIIWSIPPLSSPNLKQTLNLDSILQYEAVKLFQDRASAVSSDFAITNVNATAVIQICARLDGLPLAIELAAARVRILSVEEIASRLDDRFRLLVGSRNALPRQQTLRALVDWSYNLLSENEQVFLRRLSVFSDGWTLDAAEKVCSDEDIESWEVLDLLANLIDKSFVIGETRNNQIRYRFLETINKFSHQKLMESGENDEFEQKHVDYFLNLAAAGYGKMWGAEQAIWLTRLDEEYENLLTALEVISKMAGQEEKLLKMAGSLWRYWEIRGYFTEGRAWLETALIKNPNADDYLRANGLNGAGQLARKQGDYEKAKMLHEQSLSLFSKIGYKLNIARQLNALGEIYHNLGDYIRSVDLHEASLSLRNEIEDKEGIAVSLRQLGVIARDRGQHQQSGQLLEESLGLAQSLGDKLMIGLSLNDLGLLAHHMCEYKRAIPLFEEAMAMQNELNDKAGISESLQNMANVAKDQGNFVYAESLYKKCLTIKQELGDKRGIARVTAALAEVAFFQGKYPLAKNLAERSLELSNVLGLKRATLASIELLGFVAYYQGNYELATSYAQKSMALATELDAPQAIGYAKELIALGNYADGKMEEAREAFDEALRVFRKLNDCRNLALTYVNLARTAYRQGDHAAAKHFLDHSLSVSQELDIRWTLGFVLEIKGLLERSNGDYKNAFGLFQKSLQLAIEQENQQGIANCYGAIAGLAAVSNRPEQAARLFAAAAKLRQGIGAKMSNNDRVEYEQYLELTHQQLDHVSFEMEWSAGFGMSANKILEDLGKWL